MMRDELQARVDGCPLHRLLGLTVEDCDGSGMVTISLTARPDFSRHDERIELHGGIIATLIDVTGAYAVVTKLGQNVPTINLSVDYLRFARGEKLVATARLVKCGRSIAVVDIEVGDETGTLVAIGRGTFSSAVQAATPA